MDKKQLIISILVFIAALLSIVSYLFLGGKEYLKSNKTYYTSEVVGKWYVVKGLENGEDISLEEIMGSQYEDNNEPYVYLFNDRTLKVKLGDEFKGDFEIRKNIIYVTIDDKTTTINYDKENNIMYYNYSDELTLVLERD